MSGFAAASPAPRPSGPGRDLAGSGAKVLNIGQVLDRLRADFADITLSKIRYLEAEGLVEPARTSANYRKYSADDVARLRYVLHAQRERFLPLRVIKEELSSLDRGDMPAHRPGPRAVPPHPAPAGLDAILGVERVRMSRRELLAAVGLDEDELADLERHGLVAPIAGGGYYDSDALLVARTVALLAGHGVQARHLRAARTVADREAGLIEAATAPLRGQRGGDNAGRQAETADELAALLVRLHAALLRSRLPAGRPS
ncbi:MerR family transcriptional regulator [Candidatus Frankia alpina]|uniref:MerR family transcriptional regulator n=1 Tax=Candidatus Frankia alpina TaxID=2699483 RepID=A0A4V3Z7N0_9ACTN|nr:MerR family transcriptional regulator [Candidatus Frankia alpina]THJ74809.1 MerR family transcriptional regulator [Candidatus Frankia alpina]